MSFQLAAVNALGSSNMQEPAGRRIRDVEVQELVLGQVKSITTHLECQGDLAVATLGILAGKRGSFFCFAGPGTGRLGLQLRRRAAAISIHGISRERMLRPKCPRPRRMVDAVSSHPPYFFLRCQVIYTGFVPDFNEVWPDISTD